ncbi:membrane-bound lytic murein transglycosylase MltF [Alteromonas sediminis]|uniref:membrane-bound lytic murein transglycosylase MltF n=1 Tax=Alteromonas sediminis TaxID=2259342 RepID=UPI0023E8D9BD|nr:membrane-bound lytic murein transglycosylase MltF [Alteromonas sediminis]
MRLVSVAFVMICSACQPKMQTESQPAGQSAIEGRQHVVSDGVLHMGTVYGKHTFYIGPEGPTGFEYELAKGFSDYIGLPLEVMPFFNFEDLQEELEKGGIDFIAAGLSSPQTKTERARWGPVYQIVSHQLVYLQGNTRPRELADLQGTLSVVPGTSHFDTAMSVLPENPDFTFSTANDMDVEELLTQIAEGNIDYTITDSNTLSIVRRRYPDISVGFTVSETIPLAWQLHAQDDAVLQVALLDYFAHIRKTGFLDRLEERYFGHVRSFDFVDTKAFIDAANTTLLNYVDAFQSLSLDVDWRLLAALSYQESHWDPNAVSPTGVRGLMMLTLDTAKDWNVESRVDPLQSIAGGARYFSSLMKRIPARIGEPDRIWMALAAYNIGLGHLEDARVLTQKQGGNPDIWMDVKKRLPMLQQKRYYRQTRFGYARGNEALQYVENIRRYYDTLVWLDSQSPPWRKTPSVENLAP